MHSMAIAFLRWLRRRVESVLFLGLLGLLAPLLVLRLLLSGWDPAEGRRLRVRWGRYLVGGLEDLRRAYWPGIRFEKMADIWFHVAVAEFFSVLNATARPVADAPGSGGILVVKLAHFGDALHIFPMLRELRKQRPGARLDLLVGPWSEGLAKTYGQWDELLLNVPRLGSFERGGAARRRTLTAEVRWLLALRRRRYELVISTSITTLAEVLLAQAIHARRWVGTDMPGGLYSPPGAGVRLVPYDSRRYEAARVMGLLDLIGAPEGDSDLYYPLSAAAMQAAEDLLQGQGLPRQGRYAVLCPGAGWPGKQWLPDRFAAIGDRIRCQTGMAIVLVGAGAEKPLCDAVARQMREPVIRLDGRTTLDQLAAVLAKAAVFVGNDSGPMHLAACFQVPTVVFFGPTVASKWAPRHAAARCLQHEDCSGCISWHYRANCVHENRCMKAISVEEAWQAVEQVLGPEVQGKDAE